MKRNKKYYENKYKCKLFDHQIDIINCLVDKTKLTLVSCGRGAGYTFAIDIATKELKEMEELYK
jgi:hypothetical protein